MAATKRKMNFTNVKDGGNFSPRHVEEGDYVMKVVKVDDHTSKEGNDMWLFTCERKGDKRSSYPIYCGVDEKDAWKVRKLFIACGMNVPKKMVMVDPNKVVGKEFGAFLEDDEYEGKMRSRIGDMFPKEEVSEPEETTTSKKKKPAPAEDDEDETEDVDLDEDDEDTEEDDTDEEDSDDEEEEEEPEPAPKKKAKKAAAPVVKKTAKKKKKRPVVEEDEDEDLDLEEL